MAYALQGSSNHWEIYWPFTKIWGRHNAVDKLIGHQTLADRTPLRRRLLTLSGRAIIELLQQAMMGRILMVAAVAAPSSIAVRIVKEFDIAPEGFRERTTLRLITAWSGSTDMHQKQWELRHEAANQG
jgi:FdhD protein